MTTGLPGLMFSEGGYLFEDRSDQPSAVMTCWQCPTASTWCGSPTRPLYSARRWRAIADNYSWITSPSGRTGRHAIGPDGAGMRGLIGMAEIRFPLHPVNLQYTNVNAACSPGALLQGHQVPGGLTGRRRRRWSASRAARPHAPDRGKVSAYLINSTWPVWLAVARGPVFPAELVNFVGFPAGRLHQCQACL